MISFNIFFLLKVVLEIRFNKINIFLDLKCTSPSIKNKILGFLFPGSFYFLLCIIQTFMMIGWLYLSGKYNCKFIITVYEVEKLY